MPLMLTPDKATLDAWLDPSNDDVRQFDKLLEPRLTQPLVATAIGKVSKWNEIGPDQEVEAD